MKRAGVFVEFPFGGRAAGRSVDREISTGGNERVCVCVRDNSLKSLRNMLVVWNARCFRAQFRQAILARMSKLKQNFYI